MNAERWDNIEDAYHRARDLSGEYRSRFLDARCVTDYAIRQQIALLLAQHENAATFLNRPAVDLATGWGLTSAKMSGLSRRHIGAYEVLEPLVSGAMGEVYRAHDTNLGRHVA